MASVLQVIRMALEHAGLHPRELSMLEMHGTGTPLGDPIEVSHNLKHCKAPCCCEITAHCISCTLANECYRAVMVLIQWIITIHAHTICQAAARSTDCKHVGSRMQMAV